MIGASLSIAGEVERPLALTREELGELADGDLVADLNCLEGWSRPGLRWHGVRLSTLLALAGAHDTGRFVTLRSGEYTVVLAREQASDERVLLALERDGCESSAKRGFPRLVGPSDWDCFQSIKTVESITVSREAEQATAKTLARARIERARSAGSTRRTTPASR